MIHNYQQKAVSETVW